MPLYTLWRTGSFGEKAFAVLHCTGGDLLIALATLTAGLLVSGDQEWPEKRFARVGAIAIVLGLAYTIFSEWRNVYVSAAWSYADSMPVIPILGVKIGLSPLLQWLIVPLLAFHFVKRRTLQGKEERNELSSGAGIYF